MTHNPPRSHGDARNAPERSPDSLPLLLTEAEVAEALRVSDRTVRRLIAAGRLRVVHPTPGRTLVTRRELTAYLSSLEGRRAA